MLIHRWTLILSLGCLAANAQVKKIMIDPANVMGGTTSKYIDSVAYIPLETTKESLFGRIDQLEVTDQYFVILDQATDAILFFNKNGHFHHKVTNIHFDRIFKMISDPNHPTGTIRSFSIDPLKHLLYIESIFEVGYLYIFTEDGKRVGKTILPDHTYDYFFINGGSRYCRQIRPYLKGDFNTYKPYDVAWQKDSSAPYQYLFPVNFEKDGYLTDISFHKKYFHGSAGDSTFIYTPDQEYNLYELGASGIKNQYQLLFPQQYALPVNFATDTAYANKRQAYLREHKVIRNIQNVWKMGDYLLLDFLVPETGLVKGGAYNLMYSLKTSRLISFDHLSPDAKTWQLPVTGYMRTEILGCKGNNVYFSFPAVTMFNMLEEIGDKHPPFDENLKHFFKTQDRKSNPVLLLLKLKSNL
jgi:hypothetical protein